MRDQRTANILTVVIENRELRAQLAEVQDRCVELAVNAGELNADIEALRARLQLDSSGAICAGPSGAQC